MCLRFAHLFPVLIFPHSYLINSQVNNDFFYSAPLTGIQSQSTLQKTHLEKTFIMDTNNRKNPQ